MRSIILLILLVKIILSQPIIQCLYPAVDSTIRIPGPGFYKYIYKARLSQPRDLLSEFVRIRIIDTTSDSIYIKPFPIRYFWRDSIYRRYLCSFCDPDSPYTECPCSVIIAFEGAARGVYLSNLIEESCYGWHLPYSFSPCPLYHYSPSTTLVFHISNNIYLERVDTHTWELYFGLWNKDDYFCLPSRAFEIGPVCNSRDECVEGFYVEGKFLPSLWGRKPEYKLEFFPSNGTTYVTSLPSVIYANISMIAERSFFRLDSTSAWFIIRFETITGDTFTDTVRYGDPGTFWIVPPGKHIGWRRFGVMTMYTDIPSRGYTGVVEVCLMDVTNAPVIAFGEPTHLHPEGVSCYEDWVYVDSVTGDTTVIPDIIPAPPEPVCWRFGLISEVSEAERGEDKLNLEVVGGYLSPIQVFYRISGVGHLELYDITGKVVLRRAISAKGSEKIGIDKLNSGVYFIRVVSGERSVVRKVLVVR